MIRYELKQRTEGSTGKIQRCTKRTVQSKLVVLPVHLQLKSRMQASKATIQ